MLDDRSRDQRIEFISSSDNYHSDSSNDRFGNKKPQKEIVLEENNYNSDSYEDSGDVEDLSVLTDDNKRIKQS